MLDGLNEMFLHAEVEGWDGVIGQAQNVIIDDALHVWTAVMEHRRAVVAVIVDSRSMTGGTGKRFRRAGSARCPRESTPTRRKTGSSRYLREEARRRIEASLDSTQTIGIYDTRASEAKVEKLLPPSGPDPKPQSLLTSTINEVLARCPAANWPGKSRRTICAAGDHFRRRFEG
jgi:hypothetical protein